MQNVEQESCINVESVSWRSVCLNRSLQFNNKKKGLGGGTRGREGKLLLLKT